MFLSNKITETIIKKAALAVALLFCFTVKGQTYFSERLNVNNKVNVTGSFKFYNDTFFIPVGVYTFGPATASSCLLKVSKTGSIVTQKVFKPASMNLEEGYDIYIKNNKFYVTSISSYTMQTHAGLYTYNINCDTLSTNYYGDTVYYNYATKIEPFTKAKNKFLIYGLTDSTTGVAHSGINRPFVRVVDTNGVLSQVKLFSNNTTNHTLTGSDTTLAKGSIFCGVMGGKNYIIKLDSNISAKWTVLLPNTTVSSFNSIVSLKNGSHIVAHCKTDSSGGGNFYERAGLTKLDAAGNVVWQKFYGTKQLDIGVTSVKETTNGDFILCGVRRVYYTPSVSQPMGFLLRTDSLGNLKWRNDYIATIPVKDTIGDCYLYEVLEMPDKGFAAIGIVFGSAYFGTKEQSWLIRVDSMGCLSSGCTPVLTSLNETKNDLSIVAYPNPFANELNIKYSFKDVELGAIFQLIEAGTGRIVMQKNITDPSGQMNFDTQNIVEGMYMICVKQSNKPSVYLKVVNIR